MTGETHKKGRLFVLSAPSGSGKTTVKNLVMKKLPDLVYSVSYTTRPMRPGEINGRDYNFVDDQTFRRMIDAGELLEWAEVFGRYCYGTGKAWVEGKLFAGHNVVADLDVAGAASVRKLMPEAILIFMAPPGLAELRRRLVGRCTETEEEVSRRLSEAEVEINKRDIYDFLLVNDDLDATADELAGIIETGQGTAMKEMESFWSKFFTEK